MPTTWMTATTPAATTPAFTTPAMSSANAPDPVPTPIVLYQVRDLAAVLHREADALRGAVAGVNAHALTVRWQSSSARACLDELAELAGRMTRFASGYDEAASAVLAHAERAEANAATALRTLAEPSPFPLG